MNVNCAFCRDKWCWANCSWQFPWYSLTMFHLILQLLLVISYLVLLLCLPLFLYCTVCYSVIYFGDSGRFGFQEILNHKRFINFSKINTKTLFSYIPSLIFCCLGKCFVGLWRGFFIQKRCRRKTLSCINIHKLICIFI